MKIHSLMPTCRMRTFARIIKDELGVEVRLRGREIQVQYGRPPVIYLPAMEYAREEDLKPLYGFCLHEAGHLAFSDFKAIEDVPNYLVKMVHNAIEDVYMERKLESTFPGARDMLMFSYVEGIKRLFGSRPDGSPDLKLPEKSYLSPESREAAMATLRERWKLAPEAALPPEILANLEKYLKRLEIERAARLWILDVRRYPLALLDWKEHPWREAFEQETQPWARNSFETLDQAKRLIARLGVEEITAADVAALAGAGGTAESDERLVEDARAKVEDAREKRAEARAARRSAREAVRERDREATERTEASAEAETAAEALANKVEKQDDVNAARKRLHRARERAERMEQLEKKARERMAENRRKLRDANKESREQEREAERLDAEAEQAKRDADNADKAGDAERADEKRAEAEAKSEAAEAAREKADEAGFRAERLADRIDDDAGIAERRAEHLEELEAEKTAAFDSYAEANTALGRAEKEAFDAEQALNSKRAEIEHQARDAHQETIERAEKAAKDAEQAAKDATDAANAVLEGLIERDAAIEAPIEPGAVERIIEEQFESFKNEETKSEIEARSSTPEDEREAGDDCPLPEFAAQARKYVPYDRSLDRDDALHSNPAAAAQYELARNEWNKVITETTQRLRRLYSPEKNAIRPNAEVGRLDPRKAARAGMALRGIPGLDVSRIWRKIDVKKDPKVAVSLLLDCSASMTAFAGDKTRIRLAQEAACALSEVMRNLNIPHEIIGHTTWPEGLNNLDLNGESLATFSRFQPFQGYRFKAFEDRKPPVSVFNSFRMADNVDGEAVEWAALRLAERREKTKILIVISDGMPAANLCNIAELERHLLLTCRSVEAREDEGLFLFGIGIGNERVKEFYKNAGVYNEIGDLPKIVLGQVEYVLQKLGTLG